MAAQETRKTQKRTTTTYVVQKREKATADEGERWQDISKINMPPRSRRKKVIERALASVTLGDQRIEVRVLDEASAKAIPVKAKQQTSLEIG